MLNVLVIVVNNYPYGYGESFLKDELDVLSKSFDRILLAIPMGPEIMKDKKEVFSLPPNVFAVPINNRYTLWQKISTPFRIGPITFLRIFRAEKKLMNGNFSFSMLKVLMAYIAKERGFRFRLWEALKKRDLIRQNLVLYSYWFTEYTYALFKLKKKHPWLKVYTRTHGWDIYEERHTPPYLPLRKPIIEGIDGTFTVSEQAKNYLQHKLKIKESKIEVHRLGCQEIMKRVFHFERNTVNILSLSFILPIKHLELLIDSLAIIPESIRINWVHIGGGDAYADSVQTLAKAKLSDKKNISYQFTGTLSNTEIASFLSSRSIDLFFNVSHDEGIPVSMMEALSAGIPLVGPSVGGIPEIIDNNLNGFLISSKPQPDEILNVIYKYTSLTEDEIGLLRTNALHTWRMKYHAHYNHEKFAKRLLKGIEQSYRSCSRCILDSTDYPDITLDESGICDVCKTYDKDASDIKNKKEHGKAELQKMLDEIKYKGKKKKYDCIIGISGGVDSSYLVYCAKLWGLRPLVLHVDTGWNSSQAVQNIKRTVSKLGFDLNTYVVNWLEMKDLQLAFLKASVVDIDLPADNTIVAVTDKIAREHGVKYILTGHNIATEGWLPPNFNHHKYDKPNIYNVHKKFGTIKLKTIPLIGFFGLYCSRKFLSIKWIFPLNYVDYNHNNAKHVLESELGWQDYGSKHSENLFTRFYQEYILPEKFGVVKRKAHLGTLICSGQISRTDAIKLSLAPMYDETTCKIDKEYFIKKLELTEKDFNAIMKAEPLPHTYYKSVMTTLRKLRPLTRIIRKIGLFK